MSNKLTRRALVASAPAAGLALTAAPARTEQAADSHPEWLAEWLRVRDTINSHNGSMSEEELDEGMLVLGRLEDLICFTPATTARGIAAQVEYALADDLVGHEYTNGKDLELFKNVLATLSASALANA